METDLNNTKDDLEKELISKLDIPFFYNNLEYINKWIEYYFIKKDIKILFLMKLKRISSDYHWLHVELARFFKGKKKEGISVYILKKALENKVYDSSVILRELDGLRGTEPTPEVQALEYLYPKGFIALGREWNSFIKCLFYKEELFKKNGVFISLEEYRFSKMSYNIKNSTNYEKTKRLKKDTPVISPICKSQIITLAYLTELNIQAKDWIKSLRKKIKLFDFLKSKQNLVPREYAIVLEFFLLKIIKFVEENKQNKDSLDIENCVVEFDLSVNCCPEKTVISNTSIYDKIFMFFDLLAPSMILTRDCLITWNDLIKKAKGLETKFKSKENKHIINKQRVSLVEIALGIKN